MERMARKPGLSREEVVSNATMTLWPLAADLSAFLAIALPELAGLVGGL
jgi:hypothetical protein